MTPDDKRHGTNAGYLAHRRENSQPCEPCLTAHRRDGKIHALNRNRGVTGRVPLGQEAWNILHNSGATAIAKTTGLHPNNLYRMEHRGPDANVQRSSRDAILRAGRTYTPIGIQRRLRALAAIGYPLVHVAKLAGCHPEPLTRIRRRNTPPQLVKSHFALGVVKAYNELAGRPAADTPVSRGQRTVAAKNGWLAPLAYDDIDDPNDTGGANVHYDDTIDPAVVDRFLAGDFKLKTSRAEKVEIMRRWIASGKSERSLCIATGWKSSRYTTREDAA